MKLLQNYCFFVGLLGERFGLWLHQYHTPKWLRAVVPAGGRRMGELIKITDIYGVCRIVNLARLSQVKFVSYKVALKLIDSGGEWIELNGDDAKFLWQYLSERSMACRSWEKEQEKEKDENAK